MHGHPLRSNLGSFHATTDGEKGQFSFALRAAGKDGHYEVLLSRNLAQEIIGTIKNIGIVKKPSSSVPILKALQGAIGGRPTRVNVQLATMFDGILPKDQLDALRSGMLSGGNIADIKVSMTIIVDESIVLDVRTSKTKPPVRKKPTSVSVPTFSRVPIPATGTTPKLRVVPRPN